MADFDSDDYETEPAPANPYAHLGAKSIEAMFETRFQDRLKTKSHSKHTSPSPQLIVWTATNTSLPGMILLDLSRPLPTR
ncbi:hypothetical protein FJTKL_10230 [Diaporthe vaccinii]|uniref:Uncharacterized protein n=1 Tax=Diaporthe vaccinii TaxID=105482 RepID=A0ABR4EL09_9PEZI